MLRRLFSMEGMSPSAERIVAEDLQSSVMVLLDSRNLSGEIPVDIAAGQLVYGGGITKNCQIKPQAWGRTPFDGLTCGRQNSRS